MSEKSTNRVKRHQNRQKTINSAARETEREYASRQQAEPELVDLWREWTARPSQFIEDLLWVTPREGGRILPYRLNASQRVLMDEIEKQLASGDPVRVICLKARRGGITTLCQAVGYSRVSTHERMNGMVVAHDQDTAIEIHRISKLFYQYDERAKLSVLPEIEASNERALRFANPNKRTREDDPGLGSSLLVETAEGAQVGRGHTLQFLHGSEVGFWKRPGIMAGLEIALSRTPGSIGILESTANGTGNVFHDQWEQAVLGRSGWAPIFLPWTLLEWAHQPVTDRQRAEWEWETKEERDYAERNKLTLEQMKWRRQVMASPAMFQPGRSRLEVFQQEYPITADEAFLSSGRNFFFIPSLRALRDTPRGISDPVTQAEIFTASPLHGRSLADRSVITPIIQAQQFGPFQIWKTPEKGHDYVVAGDVSEGLKHGDDSVAVVLDRHTFDFVAKWRGRRLDPDEFGHICALIGWYYNTGLVGIELNGPGIAANLALRRLKYPRMWLDRNIETMEQKDRDRVGWKTTEVSRITMLEDLESEIRERNIGIHSAEFYKEAENFVWVTSEDGRRSKPQAAAGKHDDEVMAKAIALQLHKRGGALRAPRIKDDAIDFANPKVQPYKKKSKIHDVW